MILLGAGSSIPFNIPGMIGFTNDFKNFIKRDKDLIGFINEIEDTTIKSEQIIGTSISFDLETLLSILTDLSAIQPEKPIFKNIHIGFLQNTI